MSGLSADEYVEIIYNLLPRGRVWPGTADYQDAPTWNALIDALANEPGRVDEDASAFLEALYPDSTDDTLLPDWLRLVGLMPTDLRSDLLARLRAPASMSLPEMNTIAATLVSGTGVKHLEHPVFAVGSGAGTDLGTEQAAVTYEYAPTLWASTPDDLTNTTTTGTVVVSAPDQRTRWNNAALTASRVTMDPGSSIVFPVSGAAGGPVRFAMWLRARPSEVFCLLRIDARSTSGGGFISGIPAEYEEDWARYEVDIAGGDAPAVRIVNVDSVTHRVTISNITAFVHVPASEQRLRKLSPGHTLSEMSAHGEYA